MGATPENTLAGIDAALGDGVDGIEVDARATRDGTVVLMHDASLERAVGDPRELSQLSIEELAALRVLDPHRTAGPQPVPTLADALACVDGSCMLVIEVKERGIEEAIAKTLRAANAAGWCWIWAFDPSVGLAFRAALPEVPVALNVGPRSAERFGFGSHVDVATRAGFAAVSLAHAMVNEQATAEARRRGLAVYTWTVDERADIERVLNAGVDAVCTNFPRRVGTVLRRRA